MLESSSSVVVPGQWSSGLAPAEWELTGHLADCHPPLVAVRITGDLHTLHREGNPPCVRQASDSSVHVRNPLVRGLPSSAHVWRLQWCDLMGSTPPGV